MENLETLKTVIKFVSGGGGDVPGGGVVDSFGASTSSVATGDIAFMLLAAFVLICGACAIGAILFQRKKVIVGAHVGCVSQGAINKLAIPVIAAVTCLLALSLTAVGLGNSKALADSSGALTGGEEIIATVDEQTGGTVFSEATITNTSENAQNISSFALDAAEGIDVSDVTWKITIGEVVVFNNKLGEPSTFTAFDIAAKSSVTMKVEATGLTSDLAKSLIGKNVANSTTSYEEVPSVLCYSGKVLLKSARNPAGTALENATVTFNDTDTTTTGGDGTFTLSKTPEHTAGTITVSYSANNGDKYSVNKVTTTDQTTSASLQDLEIRKLTSLSVRVYQFNSDGTNPGLKDRYWCPAFGDGSLTKSIIKFYDSNCCEIDGSATSSSSTDYKMSDLYDNTAKTSKGHYYAFVTTGVTLRCYQVIDQTWNKTFKIKTPTDLIQTADSLIDNWNSAGTVCSDTSAKTVYFDGDDIASWRPDTIGSTTPEPKLNSQNYRVWYGAYGGGAGGVLSFFSAIPWSSVVTGNQYALYWGWNQKQTKYLWDEYGRVNYGGVVLSQTFTS